MPRLVHLYPFVPRGRHGGTLRLAAAMDGGAELGDQELHYFDAAADVWRGPLDSPALATMMADTPREALPAADSLRRRLFPSTLWESGRRPRRALGAYAERMRINADTTLLVHTGYLAPALDCRPSAPAAVVDVYDLVWSAHRNDAAAAAPPLRALRLAYAAATRPREHRALARATRLVVAGADDADELARGGLPARWIPTPTPVELVPAEHPPDDAVRVGLLGNFAHASTRESLEAVLQSELAHDPSVRIVVAGLHTDAVAVGGERVQVLGSVDRAEDFYSRVDCVVAPVLGGSGMKVKLAEGILAGRPVITTELGAAGYPPELRESFSVCDCRDLDRAAVLRALASADPAAARSRFDDVLSTQRVAAAYADVLGAALAERA